MANSPKGLEELVTQAPENEGGAPADTLQCGKHAAQDSSPNLECPCRCFFWRRSPRKLATVTPILPMENGSFGAEANGREATTRQKEVPVLAPKEDNIAYQSFSRSASSTAPVAAPVEDPQPLVLPWTLPRPEEEEEEEAAMLRDAWTGQLAPQSGCNVGRKTLVLDLDETLVHSSFRVVHTADITITVELEGEHHRVFVRKRPGVDEFLWKVAQAFEVVVYTASLAKYANPLLDELDRDSVVTFRLFREACTKQANGYIKDLSKLGRNLKDVIIIDNSPTCYSFQPHNAIPIKTWRDDPLDHELMDLVPILYSLKDVENIPGVLTQLIWGQED